MNKPPLWLRAVIRKFGQAEPAFVGATSKGSERTPLSARSTLRRAACGRPHYSACLWKSKGRPVGTPFVQPVVVLVDGVVVVLETVDVVVVVVVVVLVDDGHCPFTGRTSPWPMWPFSAFRETVISL